MTAPPDAPGERISGWDDLLLDEQGIDDALDMALMLTRRAIEGDPAVSLTVRPRDGRGPSTRAATHEFARRLDEWQYEHGEGPCVTSDREHEICVVPDLTEDDSFRDFAETAMVEGVQGVASFPLLVRETSIGSLNIFVRRPDAIDEETVSIGQQLAAMLAPMLANFLTHERTVELTEQLEEALRGRSVIERAKGLLMGRLGIDADHAFELLSAQSQHENRKVRDVASTMLAEHERTSGTGDDRS